MSTAALYGWYAILTLAAAGLYLCLPGERPRAKRLSIAGAVIAASAFAAMAVYAVRWIGEGFSGRSFFVIFAFIALVAAVRVVTHKRPVYSAVYFVLVVLAVAVLCILAAAEFLGAALVIVYGGAILVTYVFVIMLAQQAGEAPYDAQSREPLAAVTIGFVMVAAATQAMVGGDLIANHSLKPAAGLVQWTTGDNAPTVKTAAVDDAAASSDAADATATKELELPADPATYGGATGNTRQVGRELMKTYMMAVQTAGVLMLVAMVGALCIARKKIAPQDLTEQEREQLALQPDEPGRQGREAAPF